jgi:hypothetical protein
MRRRLVLRFPEEILCAEPDTAGQAWQYLHQSDLWRLAVDLSACFSKISASLKRNVYTKHGSSHEKGGHVV